MDRFVAQAIERQVGVVLEKDLLGAGAGGGDGALVVAEFFEELVVVERAEVGDLGDPLSGEGLLKRLDAARYDLRVNAQQEEMTGAPVDPARAAGQGADRERY